MNVVSKILLASLLAPLSALASIDQDIARIRPLLPPGTDVGQIQACFLHGASPAEALAAAKANYLIRDLNGDGRPDLLVISEEQPRLEDYKTNQPCASESLPDCMMIYGKRSLHLFM